MSDSPSSPGTALSRRQFISRLSRYGGSTFTALTALGLISRASGQGVDLSQLPKVADGSKRKVVVVGAGVGGMAAAWELLKLGFDVQVLEAQDHVGGRCFTIRRGTKITETTGVTQVCDFAEGLYYNPGPARFPHWHVTMDYCRELGIPVEAFVSQNENAFYYAGDEAAGPLANQRLRIREIKADLRGHTAELLAKVVDQDKLDAPLTKEDKDRLLDFIRYEGALSKDLTYTGADPDRERRGFSEWPGGGMNIGKVGSPHPMSDLLQSELWRFFHRANEPVYQTQMYAPIGGMDNIARAFGKALNGKIRLQTEVTEIRRASPGARVVYKDLRTGETGEITADYALVNLPPTILRKVPNDFAPMVKNVIAMVPFRNSAKIGLQFKRRFWEEDDRIWGGISWTTLPIAEIWYPTDGFNSQKGVLGGYYVFGPVADELGAMTPEQRVEFALAQGEKIHPQYRAAFENGFSVNWATLPYLEGCLSHFPRNLVKTLFPNLIKPDGELYLIGDWVSHLGGWQAGAFESARLAVKDIHTRALAA